MVIVISCAIVGCRVGPDYRPPPAPLSPIWREVGSQIVAGDALDLSTWWTEFGDERLVYLIELARARNFTARAALERIEEARARYTQVRGDLFPDFSGTALYSRRQFSQNGNPFSVTRTSAFDYFSAGFDAAWELDLWGKYRRSLEAADAEWEMSVEQFRGLQISLFAEVAANYVEMRTFQRRLQIAEENSRLQAETVRFIESRTQAGLKQELALAQARSNLFQTRAEIPALQQGARLAENRLCVLVGEPPRDHLLDSAQEGVIPNVSEDLWVGLPADLLRRRPDVLAAESRILSESARIGVAVAELYPQLTLIGTIQVNSHDLRRWFTADSLAADMGPSVRWNLLNFGRIRSGIRGQEARYRQAVLEYQQTVLDAIEEVEAGLAGFVYQQQRARELSQAQEAAALAVQLAGSRYRQGLIEFLDVLQTQRTLLEVQDQLAVCRGNVALQRIATYKALGGGWRGAALVGGHLAPVRSPEFEEIPPPRED